MNERRYYSVLISERDFSALEQRIFFQNAVTGEYYTGKVLDQAARELRSVSLDRFRSPAGSLPLTRGESIEKAYNLLNRGHSTDYVHTPLHKAAESLGMSKEEVDNYVKNSKTVGDVKKLWNKIDEKGQEVLNRRYKIHRDANIKKNLREQAKKLAEEKSSLVSFLAKKLKIA